MPEKSDKSSLFPRRSRGYVSLRRTRALVTWFRAKSQGWHVFAGVVIVSCVIGARLALEGYLPDGMRYSLLFPAVALATYSGGYTCGFSAALAGLGLNYMFEVPGTAGSEEFAWAAFFAPACAVIVFGTEALYAAQGVTRRTERIWRSERRLRLFVEQAPAAMAVFDRDLRYLVASRRWLQDYGLAGKDIIGQPHYEVFPSLPERWRDVHRAALAGQVLRGEEEPFPDLEGKPRWLNWEVRPWLFDDRQIGGIIIYSEDVTERCQARLALSATQELNSQILHAMPGRIAVINHTGTIVMVNEAWKDFAGAFGAETFGKTGVAANYLDVCRAAASSVAQAATALRGIESVLDGSKPNYSQEYMCSWDEGDMWFAMSVVPFLNNGDRGALIIHFDITERKKVEEELVRAAGLRAVGELAGGIAHDFGNLLTVITGNLQLAEMDLEDQSGRAPVYVRAALEAAERGAGTNRRLIAMTESRPIARRPLEISELVEQTFRVLRRMIGETIRVHVDIDSDLWTTAVDPGELEGALLNLALNARDAMPSGGKLIVRVCNHTVGDADQNPQGPRPGSYVLVEVRDTGQGMTPEVLDRAREPFFTTKEVGKGVGLGLASVARIARSTGGHLAIASEPFVGTTASLYLPRCEASVRPPPQRSGGLLKRGAGELVLVVEDDPEVRHVVKERIEALGYSVISAGSARQAIALMSQVEDVRLVFSDVVMPGGMSGFDLIRWVKAQMPGVGTLLTSGYNVGAPDSATICDDTYVLAKPYTVNELADAMSAALVTGASRSPQPQQRSAYPD